MSVEKYIEEVEHTLIMSIVNGMLKLGYEVAACGSDDEIEKSSSVAALEDLLEHGMGTSFMVTFHKSNPAGADHWVSIQQGNGDDVIVDYSVGLPVEDEYKALYERIQNEGLVAILAEQQAKGSLTEANVLLMTVYIGEASSDKSKYELLNSVSGFPIIHSKQSGRYWSLGWQDLIRLAVANGVDKP